MYVRHDLSAAKLPYISETSETKLILLPPLSGKRPEVAKSPNPAKRIRLGGCMFDGFGGFYPPPMTTDNVEKQAWQRTFGGFEGFGVAAFTESTLWRRMNHTKQFLPESPV